MSKINILGGIFFLAGLLVLGFQAISSMMTPDEIVWESWNILHFVDAEYLTWIDEISYGFAVNLLTRFTEAPIYLICITLGILCLIVGFTSRKV